MKLNDLGSGWNKAFLSTLLIAGVDWLKRVSLTLLIAIVILLIGSYIGRFVYALLFFFSFTSVYLFIQKHFGGNRMSLMEVIKLIEQVGSK